MTDIDFDILTQKVTNTALQVTPIISVPNPPSAIPLGCGIFLKINDDRYLISAGHLLNLEDWPKLMVPGADDKLVLLNGVVITTYKDSSTNNKIDFGILKFSARQNKHFVGGNLGFCNPSNIIVNHKVQQGGYYVIAGYPVSGVKKTSGKAEFKPIPVKFLTYPIKENKYEKFGFNPDHFILVKYQRKLVPFGSKEKQITKELKGISGSGLWYIPNWNDRKKGVPKFYLVGIMTENYKDKGFVAALRIDFATEAIKQFFIYSPFEHTQFDFGVNIKNLYGSEIK
ncbi:hypothetical protein [Autumnicola musiva]|uniref:Serine protease n=1 Tax=Autumnicola musiva TaxID=3075589 RepID=A0ABU3D0X6_9FLAO|nr:hypothetical protein [Zunongwangia sp. F117]MDT0675114.1 hypothetical protein [Zunongwangia sp. F117]